jgi:hypothetical protein
VLRHDGELWMAARLSFCLNVKKIPRTIPNWRHRGASKTEVLHKPECEDERCIAPAHLYLGNQKDNRRDFRASPKFEAHCEEMSIIVTRALRRRL